MNSHASAYGGPIYLVGSALATLEPGDWDLRCMLERPALDLWFGEGWDLENFDKPGWPPSRVALHREQLKQSRRLTRQLKRRVDFKLESCLYSDVDGLPIMRGGKPHLRMDDLPLSLFKAGFGDP
jgi:hypothetical protein